MDGEVIGPKVGFAIVIFLGKLLVFTKLFPDPGPFRALWGRVTMGGLFHRNCYPAHKGPSSTG